MIGLLNGFRRHRAALAVASLVGGASAFSVLLSSESAAQPGRCRASVTSIVYCQGLRPNGLGSRCCWPWGHANTCGAMLAQFPPMAWGKSAWGGACVRRSHIIYH